MAVGNGGGVGLAATLVVPERFSVSVSTVATGCTLGAGVVAACSLEPQQADNDVVRTQISVMINFLFCMTISPLRYLILSKESHKRVFK